MEHVEESNRLFLARFPLAEVLFVLRLLSAFGLAYARKV
jgi:hypothetical protein